MEEHPLSGVGEGVLSEGMRGLYHGECGAYQSGNGWLIRGVIGGLIRRNGRIIGEGAFLVVSDFQIRHPMLSNLKLIRNIL